MASDCQDSKLTKITVLKISWVCYLLLHVSLFSFWNILSKSSKLPQLCVIYSTFYQDFVQSLFWEVLGCIFSQYFVILRLFQYFLRFYVVFFSILWKKKVILLFLCTDYIAYCSQSCQNFDIAHLTVLFI